MKRLFSFFLAAVVFSASSVRAGDGPARQIRIGILEDQESVTVSGESAWSATDPETGRKTDFGAKDSFLIKEEDERIELGDAVFGKSLRIASEDELSCVKVNGKRYRGTVTLLRRNSGRFAVINELNIEDYVRGILPLEVSASWPPESLKAQAVISRTFALRSLGRHGSEGFDLCNRTHCQVYGSRESEKESTDRAVAETEAQVLFYGDDLANTVFFSNCGGRTEESSNAWETESSPRYLNPVRCRYCRNEKHYEWTQTLSQEQIARALEKCGERCELPLRSFKVSSKGSSGRAKTLAFQHRGGTAKLRASRFRMAIGPNLLRSTLLVKIRKTGSGFQIQGRGWGHGVGLCQEGAKGMALKGKSYGKILKLYYPGTQIEHL
jgi:stage II sporulation protein D